MDTEQPTETKSSVVALGHGTEDYASLGAGNKTAVFPIGKTWKSRTGTYLEKPLLWLFGRTNQVRLGGYWAAIWSLVIFPPLFICLFKAGPFLIRKYLSSMTIPWCALVPEKAIVTGNCKKDRCKSIKLWSRLKQTLSNVCFIYRILAVWSFDLILLFF